MQPFPLRKSERERCRAGGGKEEQGLPERKQKRWFSCDLSEHRASSLETMCDMKRGGGGMLYPIYLLHHKSLYRNKAYLIQVFPCVWPNTYTG